MRLPFAAALAMGIAWAPAAVAQDGPPASQFPQPAPLPAPLSAPLPAPPSLTLDEAIARALAAEPRIGAARARLDAASATMDQADVLPNPELGVELENFQGSGPYRGYRSVEATYGLTQTVELGGKRGARVAAARADRLAAGQELTAAQLDLVRDVRTAFAAAAAADRAVVLAGERVRLAGEVERSIEARVAAGRETVVQADRAGIARRQAELAFDQARQRAAAARRTLAGLIGATPLPGALSGPLDDAWFLRLDLPAPAADGPVPAETADLQRRQVEVVRGRAAVEVERSRAVPDLTLSAGVRRFRESGDNAFLVGVSIPIPVFDSNRGAIARARAEAAAAEADLAAARLDLDRRMLAARSSLEAARDTAATLKERIIPAAEQAFAFSREGYRQGKFSYLEVLDAQRTLAEAQADLIDALQGFHTARAELERLTATTGPDGQR
ncbi:TolC family protein [Oleisolibacter albus]|uniref:TolC family protein n=1 Tax=Oleisolibacter albus TaxID=2171757 RepID=UPI000DF11B8C|nr:TolC family protein [Oleisolibacter albus]